MHFLSIITREKYIVATLPLRGFLRNMGFETELGSRERAIQFEAHRMTFSGQVYNIDSITHYVTFRNQDTGDRFLGKLPYGYYTIEQLCTTMQGMMNGTDPGYQYSVVYNAAASNVTFTKNGGAQPTVIEVNTESNSRTSPLLMSMFGWDPAGGDFWFDQNGHTTPKKAGLYMGRDLIYVTCPELSDTINFSEPHGITDVIGIFDFRFSEEIQNWDLGTSTSIVQTFNSPRYINKLRFRFLRVNTAYNLIGDVAFSPTSGFFMLGRLSTVVN